MIGLVTTAFAGIKAQKFKVSQHEDGYQIWFEAEDHTERLPDNDKFFPVVVKDGAFSQAITRTGKGGGRISCTFDDSQPGGKVRSVTGGELSTPVTLLTFSWSMITKETRFLT